MRFKCGDLVHVEGDDPRNGLIYVVLTQATYSCDQIKVGCVFGWRLTNPDPSKSLGRVTQLTQARLRRVSEMIVIARAASGEENALGWKGAQP